MSLLNIIIGEDNPILLTKSEVVRLPDKTVAKLIRDMKETLAQADGLGLAAPQIGKNIRLILVALQKKKLIGKESTVIAMINPEIVWFSEEREVAEEGCLSLPKLFLPVERSKEITVEYLDEKGKTHTLNLSGLNARIVQHEVDHLNGILIPYRNAELTDVSCLLKPL